jgi:hypothetical protein
MCLLLGSDVHFGFVDTWIFDSDFTHDSLVTHYWYNSLLLNAEAAKKAQRTQRVQHYPGFHTQRSTLNAQRSTLNAQRFLPLCPSFVSFVVNSFILIIFVL